MFLQSKNYYCLIRLCNSFVTLCATVLKTPVSCASCLRDFLCKVSGQSGTSLVKISAVSPGHITNAAQDKISDRAAI